MAHNKDKDLKDLTCSYWAEGFCRFSERACLYSHHHTGTLADKHRSKAARAASTFGRNASPSSLNGKDQSPAENLLPGGRVSYHPDNSIPSQAGNLPPSQHDPQHPNNATPPPASFPSHSRAMSATLPSSIQPSSNFANIPRKQSLPMNNNNSHYQHGTRAWSRDRVGPAPNYKSAHVRRMSNLNPNAPTYQASPFVGGGGSHKEQTLNTSSKPADTGAASAVLSTVEDLGINGDDFAMESFDRKGKGRTLSSNSNSRPSVLAPVPASDMVFQERANGYSPRILKEMDARPPRSIEMPNLFWRLGIRLPTTLYLPPLPPQIEELWVRRDTVSRNLRGAKAWVKFFNDDVVYMRITGDTEAEAYAKWGEPYLEQSVAIDIPKFTLEMHKIEEAMVTCMKGM